MQTAKFIHGDRVVYMIDVPDDQLEDYIADLQERLGMPGVKAFEEQFKQFIKSMKDDDKDSK